MNSLSASEAAIVRAYVEEQVRRFVLPGRPSLALGPNVRTEADGADPPLRWAIESSDGETSGLLISRHYLIEVDAHRREIVIWFGAIAGFAMRSGVRTTRDVMRPAVHVPFPELLEARLRGQVGPPRVPFPFVDRVTRDAEILTGTLSGPEEDGLAAVLLKMLESEREPRGGDWDRVAFPFSGCRY